MAEREGFEPSVGLRPQRFSRPSRSTTPAPLRKACGRHREPAHGDGIANGFDAVMQYAASKKWRQPAKCTLPAEMNSR